MNIPVNSVMGYIGMALLVFGTFMVLAGFDVISIQQVTVKKGRKTWILGIVFAILGFLLILPELGISTPTTAPPTDSAVTTTEILQPDQQAKCDILKLDAISPPAVLENQTVEYKLIGSGFCPAAKITISGYASVGNIPESNNSQPIEVSSDGTWLSVYINHVLDPEQSGGYIMVENPDGNTASLYVNFQE